LIKTIPDPILTLVGGIGIARNSDLKARGVHPQQLRRLLDTGALVRVGRGLYALPNVVRFVYCLLCVFTNLLPKIHSKCGWHLIIGGEPQLMK
jgi:Transcriptional regulator, AbiEi antitoxin